MWKFFVSIVNEGNKLCLIMVRGLNIGVYIVKVESYLIFKII